MKRFCFLLSAFLLFLPFRVNADGPDDEYVQIYNLIQQGDSASAAGQKEQARAAYSEAAVALKKFKAAYPNWNAQVIEFRSRYVESKLGAIEPRPAPTGVVPTQPKPTAAVPGREIDPEIRRLNDAVRQLESEKSVLEAKLKEAWKAQPAAVDPRELAKAEEKIKELEKEKALLQVSLDQAEKNGLKAQKMEDLQRNLKDTKKQLDEQTDTAAALQKEKQLLQERLDVLTAQAAIVQKLTGENEALKKRIAESQKSVEKAVRNGTQEKELADSKNAVAQKLATIAKLEAELKTLRSEKEVWSKEKRDLQTRLDQMAAARSGGKGDSSRMQELIRERDDLQQRLQAATEQLATRKPGSDAGQFEYLTNQLAILRARLEVYEAKKVPYTPEELALFKEPQLAAAKKDVEGETQSFKRVPAGAAALLSEAQRAFKQHRYEDAEKNFQQVLKLDEKNVYILRELAAAQFQMGQLEQCESSLKRALAESPNFPEALSLYGILKFRQGKYDQALDQLGRAAQLDPADPETQNYLGITLDQKGQRAPAETALRRAVQLAPNYGGAHLNLAVVYATEQPPFPELAKWHYQKALANGEKPNPDLEKLIEAKK